MENANEWFERPLSRLARSLSLRGHHAGWGHLTYCYVGRRRYFSVHNAGWGLSVGLIRSKEWKQHVTCHILTKFLFPFRMACFKRRIFANVSGKEKAVTIHNCHGIELYLSHWNLWGAYGFNITWLRSPRKYYPQWKRLLAQIWGGNRLKEIKS